MGLVADAALGRAMRLSPPVSPGLDVTTGRPIRTRDGVILRTDHYAPRLSDAPTVLIRTPYGRNGVTGLIARAIAARGFHVLVQSCRGTAGSGGTFVPLRFERDDGLDTVAWLRDQPWFTGKLGTFGPSYLGFAQWAIADVPELAAMATVVTASQFRDPTYSGGSFALYTALSWAALLRAQSEPWLANLAQVLRRQPRLRRGLAHLPLGEADVIATGDRVEFFREWLANREEIEYWAQRVHHERVPRVTAPVLMIGGWQDIFLPWQLRDYAALRGAGARPQLTIGPWTHGSLGLIQAGLRESLDWLRQHLRGERIPARAYPVRLYLGGAGQWRGFADWPPAGTRTRSWFLQPDAGLAPRPPGVSPADIFHYDPVDPTPSLGGPVLLAHDAGVRDNRALEARADVLVYSGPVLTAPVEVIGPVTARVYARGSRPHFDIFVRLCDVAPSGRSANVCDGLARVRPGRVAVDPDGWNVVEVDLWPAAHRFDRGHRIRVQVSGGAFPRYPRSSGTDEVLAVAVGLRPVRVEIAHDPRRGSAIRLPIYAR